MSSALSIGGKVQSLALYQGENRINVIVSSAPMELFPALVAEQQSLLSQQELDYFRGRQFEKKQKSYLTGRFAAKLALAKFLPETDWKAIDVYPGVFEQPLVRCRAATTPGVSITHCEDLAMALAFPLTHPMGIDVEIIDLAMVATMKSQMCPSEIKWAGSDEINRCALIWTAKEALSKALKCGLTTSFELLEVEDLKATGNGWQGTYRNFKQYRCYSWLTGRHALSITVPMQLALPPDTDLRPLLT